jgi:GGDEF domain-containing protein
VSIGITYPSLTADPNANPVDVLKEADEAMYVAKHQGKNGFAVFARP